MNIYIYYMLYIIYYIYYILYILYIIYILYDYICPYILKAVILARLPKLAQATTKAPVSCSSTRLGHHRQCHQRSTGPPASMCRTMPRSLNSLWSNRQQSGKLTLPENTGCEAIPINPLNFYISKPSDKSSSFKSGSSLRACAHIFFTSPCAGRGWQGFAPIGKDFGSKLDLWHRSAVQQMDPNGMTLKCLVLQPRWDAPPTPPLSAAVAASVPASTLHQTAWPGYSRLLDSGQSFMRNVSFQTCRFCDLSDRCK